MELLESAVSVWTDEPICLPVCLYYNLLFWLLNSFQQMENPEFTDRIFIFLVEDETNEILYFSDRASSYNSGR